jgi:hypothetical protein
MAEDVIGSLWVVLGLDASRLKEGKTEAEKALSEFEKSIGTSEGQLKKMAIGIGMVAGAELAVGAAMTKAALDAARYGDRLHDLTLTTNLSERNLQRLKYTLEANNGNFEEAAASMAFFARSIKAAEDPTSNQAEALKKLGINAVKSNGEIEDMNTLLPRVIDRLNRMDNNTERLAATTALFGRNTGEVAKLIELGSTGLAKYGDEAERLGILMSPEELAVQQQFSEQWARMNTQLQQLYIELGTQVIPIVQQIIPVFEQVMPIAESMIDVIGMLTNGFISLAESAMAAQSAVAGVMSGDFSAAQSHLSNAISAAERGYGSGEDLAGITTSGGDDPGSKGTRGTAISKSKALYAQRNPGKVQQIVNIKATQQSPNQINTVVKAASQSLATQLRIGGL